MKKILLTLIMSVAVILPCFAFSACGSDNYTGKQFVLIDVSATYDDTVSEATREENESALQTIKDSIDSDKPPVGQFYSSYTNLFITNCNGTYRMTKYLVKNGKVEVDKTTSTSNDKFKIPVRLRFYGDTSLEDAVFSTENDNLILTESFEGVTVRYSFTADGDLNESANNYVGYEFKFIDSSYMSYTTDEEKDATEKKGAEDIYNSSRFAYINFPTSSSCIISNGLLTSSRYDIKQDSTTSQHAINYGNNGYWSNYNVFWIYGDLLVRYPSSSGIHSNYSYYIKSNAI